MTALPKNRIAVISADESLSAFFAWEARACGCPVRVFTEPPQALTDFDLAVLDLRAGLCLPESAQCRLAIVVSEKKNERYPMADMVWEWPIAVDTVRSAYEWVNVTDSVMEAREDKAEQRGEAIYLLSDGERTVLYRNRIMALTESEWRLLALLGERSGELVSKEELAAVLASSEGNAVNVHLCHLRQKLEAPFGVRLLETVRGGGYRLKVPLKRWEG